MQEILTGRCSIDVPVGTARRHDPLEQNGLFVATSDVTTDTADACLHRETS